MIAANVQKRCGKKLTGGKKKHLSPVLLRGPVPEKMDHQKKKRMKNNKKANKKKKAKQIGKNADCRLQSAMRRLRGSRCVSCTLANERAKLGCCVRKRKCDFIKTTKICYTKNAK